MIQNLLMFLTIVSCCALVAWSLFPLLRARRAGTVGALDELVREQTTSLLSSLDSLYASREEEQVSEEDFVNIERRLILELARIYHKQGLKPQLLEGEAGDDGSLTCVACQASIKAEYRFCPECGAGQNKAA